MFDMSLTIKITYLIWIFRLDFDVYHFSWFTENLVDSFSVFCQDDQKTDNTDDGDACCEEMYSVCDW